MDLYESERQRRMEQRARRTDALRERERQARSSPHTAQMKATPRAERPRLKNLFRPTRRA